MDDTPVYNGFLNVTNASALNSDQLNQFGSDLVQNTWSFAKNTTLLDKAKVCTQLAPVSVVYLVTTTKRVDDPKTKIDDILQVLT